MKNYKCLVCGNVILNFNETNICPHCNCEIHKDIILKTNPIKVLKYKVFINCLNNDFNKNILLLENTYNNLYLEYFKMFTFKILNKQYDENIFFSNKYEYTEEELDFVINHMIEKRKIFNNENVYNYINNIPNNEKYLKILNNINNINEKIKEKDLRTLLFDKTVIPVQSKYESRKKEGKAFLAVSCILYVLLIVIVLLMFDKSIKYQMMNIVLLLPSYILTTSISKIFFKKDKIYINLLIFIFVFYFSTLICSFMCTNHDTNFIISHFNGLINTPADLIESLMNTMEGQL